MSAFWSRVLAILASRPLSSLPHETQHFSLKFQIGTHQRDRRITQVAILVAALIGSAAPVEAGTKAGRISYQDLVPGGMAMGGITSLIQGPTSSREGREAMAQLLESHIVMTRADIPLITADRVRSAVGPESYDAMLADLQLTGEVTAAALASLRAALQDSVRYVVVARLEKEKIDRFKDEEEDPDNDPYTHDARIVKSVYRKVEVSFRVYDLRDGTQAWNTRLAHTSGNESSAPVGPRIFKSYTVAGILESTSDEGPPDPQPLETIETLPGIFEKFVGKLPKKK